MSVIITCCLIEGASRILPLPWREERSRFYEYDPEFGWRGTPFAGGAHRTTDFSTRVALNSRGLRSREVSYEKAQDERRVLFLGDSFTWGFGVNEGERFTDLIERDFTSVITVNGGHSGFGTDQELLWYRGEGIKYSPDVVIVAVHLRSDLKNNISSRQYGFQKPVAWQEGGRLVFRNSPVATSSRGQRITRMLQRHSAFLVWLFSREMRGVEFGKVVAKTLNRVVFDDEPAEMLSNYAPETATCEMLSLLASDIRGSGARPVFVAIPDVRPDTRTIEERPEYGLVRQCLSQLPARLVDLTDMLTEMLTRDADEPVVFAHDLHWTPITHQRVAREVSVAVREIGADIGLRRDRDIAPLGVARKF